MSLLLDALNKADQERKRNEATPGINSNHEHVVDHGARNHSILLIVTIIIGLAILLAAIYWLGQRSTVPATITPPATKAVSSTPKPNKTPAVSNDTKTTQPEAAQDAGTDDPSTSEETVASLYQNTQVPATNAAITMSTPPAVTTQPTPEQAPAVVPNVAVPTSIAQFANLPEIHDLPNNILEKIPSLGYSEHNYNANGGNVKINGEIKHVNDQLGNGIVIDKILEDGMILHIDNYSFKMRAMNSWVNM